MLLVWICTGLNLKFGRRKCLLSFYRLLLASAEVLVDRDKGRREEERHSDSLRCCAFFGKSMAVVRRAVLPRECVFERKNGFIWKGE